MFATNVGKKETVILVCYKFLLIFALYYTLICSGML